MIFIREAHEPHTYKAIHAKDVLMVSSKKDYSMIWVEGQQVPYEVYASLTSIQARFPAFIRCHFSYLVNPDKIRAVNFKERFVLLGEMGLRAMISPDGEGKKKMKELVAL